MPDPTTAPRSYAVALPAQVDCPVAWREPVLAALAAAGIVTDPHAAVGIAVTPAREVSSTVDDWSVSSLPHLLIGTWPWAVEVGPWAAPGVGPCARCVAASVLDDGRSWHHASLPMPLLAQAAGAAARDLATWGRGEAPHTWLTSWRVDHDPVPTPRRWQRHPYCGCAWFDTA